MISRQQTKGRFFCLCSKLPGGEKVRREKIRGYPLTFGTAPPVLVHPVQRLFGFNLQRAAFGYLQLGQYHFQDTVLK